MNKSTFHLWAEIVCAEFAISRVVKLPRSNRSCPWSFKSLQKNNLINRLSSIVLDLHVYKIAASTCSDSLNLHNMDQIPDLKITACLHGLRKLQPASTVLKPVIPSGTTFTESLLKVNTKSQRENHLVESSSDETGVPTLTEWKDTEQKAYNKPSSPVMKDITIIRELKASHFDKEVQVRDSVAERYKEIILEKSRLKIFNEREVDVMGPPTVPSQLQQLKQAVELKRKRKSKSRAEIEIVGDGSNSQKHADVNSDISPSKEQNSQVNYEEIVVKMEVDDSSMLQGQYVTLNGEKFIIKQEDNFEGSYCLNKLDGNVLNSPLDDKRDESGIISKEPSECYEGKMFFKREIEDNDFSYTSREKQSNNANFDDSQRISQWHGSEMFIKREIEDEDNNFAYITGEAQSNNSDIQNSQRISQCHGSEILIKKEIDDANLFFSHKY
ncbi:unnamed protein product [Mytilus edulis]|uniref:Uncharacterized protein n=1 Tax=Mytilus edulis TaxID=6550 RepID=A0A8S3RKW1_MYTED|nr:unnamed protein product [Mytilus edulis]